MLATACGWDPDTIDAMTLPRFQRLCRYWAKRPPAHLLLGALCGLGTRERRPSDLGELLAMVKGTEGILR